MLQRLQRLPAFRPGVAYVLQDTLYLAPTNRSPSGATMRSSRGPGFAMSAASGFEPLPAELSAEPSAEELAEVVDGFYAAAKEEAAASTGERDQAVVFQGQGDPLEALDVVLETVRLMAARRSGLAFRLNTLGLCDAAAVEALLSSEVLQRGADANGDTRIARVSVFLPAAEPEKYAELVQPHTGRGFATVCSFITRLAEAGVEVECTAVRRPDVNVDAVERLASSLGCRSFRARSWVE